MPDPARIVLASHDGAPDAAAHAAIWALDVGNAASRGLDVAQVVSP